ncbi:MAG: hypothetical protein CMG82_09285 [Marinobacter sp.]|nr:hypothetical protein [Marinobacter sp.]
MNAGPGTNTGGNVFGQVAIPVLDILAIFLKLTLDGLADVLKSLDRKVVPVRFRLRAPLLFPFA